jgi:hypothetical protein
MFRLTDKTRSYPEFISCAWYAAADAFDPGKQQQAVCCSPLLTAAGQLCFRNLAVRQHHKLDNCPRVAYVGFCQAAAASDSTTACSHQQQQQQQQPVWQPTVLQH